MKNKIFIHTDCLDASTLEEYLNQKLVKEKVFEVESHLLDCEFCSDAIDGFLYTTPAIEIGSTVDKMETSLFEKKKASRFSFGLKIAASLLLLVFFGMAISQYKKSSENQSLAGQFYQTYAGGDLIVTRGVAQEKKYDPFLEKAITYFELGDFEEAESLLNHYLGEHVENSLAKFYLAMTKLESKEFSEAIALLEEVRINDPSKYDEATWYLALSLLETHRVEEGKKILEEIISSSTSVKKDKAKHLLESI